MESQPTKLTLEDRLLAALAHASVLLSLFGPLGPGFVWIGQRRKSRYAVFQSLQAMGYQAFVLWVGLSLALIGLLVFIVPLVWNSYHAQADKPDVDSLLAQATQIQSLLVVAWGALSLPGVVGAVLAGMGRDFRYPMLGRRLERFLFSGGDEINEAREEDWVAGICHSSAVVVFWGMIFPWAVWSTQKVRSPRLRFQALQAFLFQLLAVLAFGLAFLLLGCMMAGVVALAQYMNSPAGVESDAGLYLILSVLAMLIFMAIMLLSLPTFHLFALIAWVRVTRGQEYLYPVVGKRLRKRMKDEG